jgi:Tfp pilus assembly protein FimT
MVEIIVVLLIMAVLLTMTAVSLSSASSGVAARESAGGVLMALRYARSYAVIHGRDCRVTFSRQDGSYDLTVRIDPDEDKFEAVTGGHRSKLDERVRFLSIAIQSRDGQTENPDVITFRPTGEADAASIELSDGRVVYSLLVAPNSGLVKMYNAAVREIPNDREDLDVRT